MWRTGVAGELFEGRGDRQIKLLKTKETQVRNVMDEKNINLK